MSVGIGIVSMSVGVSPSVGIGIAVMSMLDGSARAVMLDGGGIAVMLDGSGIVFMSVGIGIAVMLDVMLDGSAIAVEAKAMARKLARRSGHEVLVTGCVLTDNISNFGITELLGSCCGAEGLTIDIFDGDGSPRECDSRFEKSTLNENSRAALSQLIS
ncbi:hypothetical protein B0H13DRAFT_1861185 [Mycena leptocephala]|nr:hypothetical protein B0H13DRAFT_1873745 [Mycena leptocephala]KAJ7927731.1 hypothetical protein B0H13DRAFT_1861185 [Mycena leptocephala]